MISMIVFLGNYGKEYEKTRHNVAWEFANQLSFCNSLSWQRKFKGMFAQVTIENRQIYFLQPYTYMNLSGESIAEAAKFYKVKPEEILVIHDELELPLGTVSLKWAGGLGGHNGLRSTKEKLGTADFWRLRFGIGRPSHSDISGYVLSKFSSDEQIVLSQVFMKTEALLQDITRKKPESLLESWKKVNFLL